MSENIEINHYLQSMKLYLQTDFVQITVQSQTCFYLLAGMMIWISFKENLKLEND